MWMLPTNKSLLYALGIGLTLASVYGAGYTHARRIYRGEIAQLQQRHTEQALAAIVPADKFQPTKDKLASFAAGAGTVLFFEDQTVVKGLQDKFPPYAENFPIWAEHADAMHQYAIWTALASINVGASLQHYNPVIDEAVARTWNVPTSWKLRAQLVFGGIAAPAGEKSFEPVEARLKVYGL